MFLLILIFQMTRWVWVLKGRLKTVLKPLFLFERFVSGFAETGPLSRY
ncbi:hypothetical protein HMPREF9418_2526 [Neisseria macacae ATCC 33926]|uniref:Uncharacterized protein n=1 Tax=Neisseria macacae ATCC 33926 TaxID=997348 RepID=A0AA36UH72_9NEIS|nr:hypothetical protein HMPREF9418_2526 [Neisseria macacae ATCC 33926]